MGIAKRSLRGSFPPGSVWTLKGELSKLVDAIGNVLDTLRDYLRGTVDESVPGNAEETLAEWYAQLGIKRDSTQSIATQQQRARQAWTALGGQSKEYIEEQVQKAYPNVSIQEIEYNPENMVGLGQVGKMQVTDGYPEWLSPEPTDGSFASFDYRVVGEVEDNADFLGLQNLIDRIQPATHRPTYDVEILNQTETAEVGLGMVGLAQVGRTKND